jgi:putative thymidine phosphorylase
MKCFKLRKVPIQTGGPLVAVINREDSEHLNLKDGDRIQISLFSKKGKLLKKKIAIVDITSSSKVVKLSELGLYEDTYNEIFDKKMKKYTVSKVVTVEHVQKPESLMFIKKKLEGKRLTKDECRQIIADIADDTLSPIETTYFVAGAFSHPFTHKETIALTEAMIETGERLSFDTTFVVDKHCVGGVAGNRTTPIYVSILAASGLTVPKTSSRAITSGAGTVDTLEVICPVSFSTKEIKKLVKKTNACMVWGGAVNLAPADDKIIRIESPLNINSQPLILSSVLSKKASVGATHLVIDIPYGKGSKITTKKEAHDLKESFERLSESLNMKTAVVLTDGTNPVGNGIGPLLEARDVLSVLEGNPNQPRDLRRRSLTLAGKALELTGKTKKGKGYRYAEELLESGAALQKFKDIIKAQGGKNPSSHSLKTSSIKHHIKATKTGTIKHIENNTISAIVKRLGAPRDKRSGIYLHKKAKENVTKGETLYTLYAESQDKLEPAVRYAQKHKGYHITENR